MSDSAEVNRPDGMISPLLLLAIPVLSLCLYNFLPHDVFPLAFMVIGMADTKFLKPHRGRALSGSLNESGMLPSNIIEFFPDATMVIDKKGKVIAWNRAMETMTGVKAKAMIGKGDHEYAIPFYGQRKPILVDMLEMPVDETSRRYDEVTEREGRLEASTIKARLKGKDLVLWGTASKLYNAKGKVVGAIECIRDVTVQKRMEDELRVQEEKYRLMTTHIKDGIAIVDLSGRIMFANPAALNMTGYSALEIQERQFAGVTTDKDRDIVIEYFSHALAGRPVVSQLEIDIMSKHGQCMPIELNAGHMRDKSGAINGLVIAFRDITERRKAEEALLVSHGELEQRVEERTADLARAHRTLQAIIDTIPAGVIVASSGTGCVSYANQSAVSIFSSEIRGLDLLAYQRPYTLLRLDRTIIKPKDMPLYRSLYFGERMSDVEMFILHPDGRELAILFSSAPIRNEKGSVIDAVASAIDITERKRIESALRESEVKFRVLAETTPSAICINKEGRFIYVNPAMDKITGFTRDELLAMNFLDLVHPDSREVVKEHMSARLNGLTSPQRYEIEFITKCGDGRWAEIMPGLIEYQGKPATIATAVDITDRKHAEESLKDAKEQAELYIDLMGHDINNMNQVAMGYLELAKMSGDKKECDKLISRSLDMLGNGSELIDTVRKVQQAVGGGLKLEPVDLDNILAEEVAEYSMIGDREISVQYTPGRGRTVMANRLLKDSFSNILGNAIKHSSGPLIIRVDVADIVEWGKLYYRITVEDNGPGIQDELKKKVFSRLNRGRTRAAGSGLGLYLVKTLVKDFKGSVWVEDRVTGDYSKGCRFIVQLPAMDTERA